MIHDPFGRRSSHLSESQQLTFTNKHGYAMTPSTMTHKLCWGLGSSCLVKCRSSDYHTAVFLKSRKMCNVKSGVAHRGKLAPPNDGEAAPTCATHVWGQWEKEKATTERSSQTQARNTVDPKTRGFPGELQEVSKPMHLTLAEILLTDTVRPLFQFWSHPFFKSLPRVMDMDASF